MAEHLRAGTGAWLEHPAPAVWAPRAPTSFRWPPLVALSSAPCAATTVFDQCEHQASDIDPASVGRAPTCVVSLRMPGLHNALHCTPGQGKCSHGPRAHVCLLGKDASGAFRTASKKVYPPGMCAALASSIWHSVLALTESPDAESDLEVSPISEQVMSELNEFYVSACSDDGPPDPALQPDYAGFGRPRGHRRVDPEKA
eukprot:2564606-Pyramimonas_sp.AAC.1